jgi:hypothetical protein
MVLYQNPRQLTAFSINGMYLNIRLFSLGKNLFEISFFILQKHRSSLKGQFVKLAPKIID